MRQSRKGEVRCGLRVDVRGAFETTSARRPYVVVTVIAAGFAPWWQVIQVCVRDSAGAPRLEWSGPIYLNQDVVTASGQLLVGTYSLEDWTDSGLRAAGEIVVETLGELVTVTFDLQ